MAETPTSSGLTISGRKAKSIVELSFTALRVREVLKWRRTIGDVVAVAVEGRVSVLKDLECAISSALMRATS